jgi:cytochrome c oxidase accessory protein FixG
MRPSLRHAPAAPEEASVTSPPIPTERVLPTLNQDGTRRRIRPKLYKGPLYTKRLIVAWALIALFVAMPLVKLGGKPLILLDVAARQFTFFGRTFLATDGVLLMLLMLAIFVGIIWLTALVGRGWCGWGCPQTVYMEYLFRPIERLLEGDRNAQLKLDERGGGLRRPLKQVIFAVLSVVVANVFLAYFVGVDVLLKWVRSSPAEHPGGFGVMAVTAGLVFFDFAYFREQMCTVICPYARLQSALLDKDSLVIGYDARRGEPRTKGKPKAAAAAEKHGDCIDCGACVVACPTGIDIREGLQLECIACGQCVDACNTIMPKLGRPPELVRYASQRWFEEGKRRVLRTRVLVYSGLLFVLVAALVAVGLQRTGADVTVLRGIGAPFVVEGDVVRNQLRVKVENRHTRPESYGIELLVVRAGQLVPATELGLRVIAPENPLSVAALDRRSTSIFVLTPRDAFASGKLPVVVRVKEPSGDVQDISYQLLGPFGPGRP